MIEAILPAGVVASESFGAPPLLDRSSVHPAEAVMVSRAVPSRQADFADGRRCAHDALAGLGCADGPILADSRGAPCWPDGVVGSITHCTGYRAAVAARAGELHSIGIDAEPDADLPSGLLAHITDDIEWLRASRLAEQDLGTRWELLYFSAKEAVYKAWYPLTSRSLGFRQVSLEVWPDTRRFEARLLVEPPVVAGTPLTSLCGGWTVAGGLLLTAVTVPGVSPSSPEPIRSDT